MMLAWLGRLLKGLQTDAHDAGLAGLMLICWLGRAADRAAELMLMMLAWLCGLLKRLRADAHDAGFAGC